MAYFFKKKDDAHILCMAGIQFDWIGIYKTRRYVWHLHVATEFKPVRLGTIHTVVLSTPPPDGECSLALTCRVCA